MMRDEAIAAAHVEHVGLRREHTSDFERHVIRAANFAASSHALEATFDDCSQTRHWRRSVQAWFLVFREAEIQKHSENKTACATGANLCRQELLTTERQISAYEDPANGDI
jgi:hypothetical protein